MKKADRKRGRILQRWQEPGERGTPDHVVRLGRDATYADRRAFYLQALHLARRAEPWVRKSFQRDLARLRRERQASRSSGSPS